MQHSEDPPSQMASPQLLAARVVHACVLYQKMHHHRSPFPHPLDVTWLYRAALKMMRS